MNTQRTQGDNQTLATRQGAIIAIQGGIAMLETELGFQRQILGQLTGRAGNAGGIAAARRATGNTAGRPAGGGTGGGGGTNREWIAKLLRSHTEGLTAPQMKVFATNGRRQVHASFPYDSLRTLKRNGEITQKGDRYYLAGVAGTGQVARSGTARLPVVGRQRKAPGRAMRATA